MFREVPLHGEPEGIRGPAVPSVFVLHLRWLARVRELWGYLQNSNVLLFSPLLLAEYNTSAQSWSVTTGEQQ